MLNLRHMTRACAILECSLEKPEGSTLVRSSVSSVWMLVCASPQLAGLTLLGSYRQMLSSAGWTLFSKPTVVEKLCITHTVLQCCSSEKRSAACCLPGSLSSMGCHCFVLDSLMHFCFFEWAYALGTSVSHSFIFDLTDLHTVVWIRYLEKVAGGSSTIATNNNRARVQLAYSSFTDYSL